MYDTIIIGAGISGLAAAWHLKERNVLGLEKEPTPGGRIKTHTKHGISYELGAVFGFSAASLPFAVKSAIIDEADEPCRAFLDTLRYVTAGRRGEPVLYYWIERQSECPDLFPALRLFYHCADKGQISAAWATLARAAPM